MRRFYVQFLERLRALFGWAFFRGYNVLGLGSFVQGVLGVLGFRFFSEAELVVFTYRIRARGR